jgi:uncharacterized protein (TIGR00297 family)
VNPFQILMGAVLSGFIGLLAYWRKSLSPSGVAGAVLVGTAIFGFGGWVWGMVLIAFFVSSSLLSHYGKDAKAELAEKFAKGHRRDLGQVLANASVGAILALAYPFFPGPLTLAAFVGAMATVTGDTWATELGVLSKQPPRLLTTWKRVDPGTSGGISAAGTLASVAGSLTIGLAAWCFLALDREWGRAAYERAGTTGAGVAASLVLVAALGGLAGSLFDSLLGATVQAMYYSEARGKETEKRLEADGSPNLHVRGWRWLGNDWVNLFSSLVGALVGAVCWILFPNGFV